MGWGLVYSGLVCWHKANNAICLVIGPSGLLLCGLRLSWIGFIGLEPGGLAPGGLGPSGLEYGGLGPGRLEYGELGNGELLHGG